MKKKAEKTAVIIASRPLCADMPRYIPGGAFVAAADAGWLEAKRLKIPVQLAVGDFDSSPAPVPGKDAGEVILLPAEKDDSDTHAAAKELLRRGYLNFVLLGALGGRADHHCANLQTMLYIARNGGMAEAVCEGCLCYCIGPAYPLRLESRHSPPGCGSLPARGRLWLSVFAAGGPAYGVCESGVRYPLKNAVLTPETPLGLSNEFSGKTAKISCQSGYLYVFLTSDE